MSEAKVQYKLVMPVDLHRQLSAEAERNRRSLSAELVSRLQQSLSTAPNSEAAAQVAHLSELALERKLAANHWSHVSVVLAKQMLNLIDMLTPKQRAAKPEVGVFKTFADVVVDGRGEGLQDFIDYSATGVKPKGMK